MHSQKFKYQEFLTKFSKCPPESYTQIQNDVFRWVHKEDLENSFTPLNLLNDPPPRVQDSTDLMYKGYGLSLFDTFDNGIERYKSLYKRKRNASHEDFIKEKGDSIAKLDMSKMEQGVCGDFNISNGHFTFHEYEGTDLSKKVVNITDIFDANENFKR